MSLGLCLWLYAATVDVEAAATAEARQGQAPVVAGQAPTSATITAVTPSLQLATSASDGYLRLRYYPRISWVLVRGSGNAKPFVLHNLDLSGLYRSLRGVVWSARASLNTGDTDYSALALVLGRNQRQLPDITGFTYLLGGAGVAVNIVRNWQLEITLDGYRRSTISRAAAPVEPTPGVEPPVVATTPAVYPSDTGVTLTPALVHTIDRLNALDLRLGATFIAVSNGRQVMTTGPLVAWRHIMGRNELFRAAAGFVFAHDLSPATNLDPNAVPLPPTDPFSPLAELSVTRLLGRTRAATWTTTVLSSVSYYFDPINSTSGPLGAAGWQLAVAFPPRTTASLDVYFATSFRSKPLASNPDETVVSATLPIRYRLSRHWTFELGGRYSDRAPHLEAKPFRFHQRELWVYGLVTATIGSGHSTTY